jgi:hypothetical protein
LEAGSLFVWAASIGEIERRRLAHACELVAETTASSELTFRKVAISCSCDPLSEN